MSLSGLAALGMLIAPLPALASGASAPSAPFQCNGTYSNRTISGNVVVPAGDVCILTNSSIGGSVLAATNAYFEAGQTRVAGDVVGTQALTLYLHDASTVSGNLVGYQTPQVFVYGSTVGGSVLADGSVAPGYGHFQLCGNIVTQNIAVAQMGPDVLIGDPAAGCGANTVQQGSIGVAQNNTYAEMYVIGNNLLKGSLYVAQNTGASDKRVQQNSGSQGSLDCQGNSAPFTGSPNGGFKTYGDKVNGAGQCS
jgi:hypothetical protein